MEIMMWSRMEEQIWEYVTTCTVCARNKTSSQAQMGVLQPLPTPKHPWSDISMDFITRLPPSQVKMVICTVVDRFSKMVHFIPMVKLPTAKETAKALLYHVCRLHRFPSDVVSDQECQFVSQFWKEFCVLIGATSSLTSFALPLCLWLPTRVSRIQGGGSTILQALICR
ncbi:hypothetical protein L3Q82_005167 [Scortum barcoo]|uniref:Uncharacterized protein n=1 Tax=Scortum barcoo TaxID=214431 RepID=A0ACB8VA23_9TELE|nr:hypothetical protein L3Q82_005167 [Scortum barcoo]